VGGNFVAVADSRDPHGARSRDPQAAQPRPAGPHAGRILPEIAEQGGAELITDDEEIVHGAPKLATAFGESQAG
jgi:hypothetical protein